MDGYVVRMGQLRCSNMLAGETKENATLKTQCRRADKRVVCQGTNWTNLAQHRAEWRTLVNKPMNCGGPKNMGHFLNS